jgi:peptidoglycan/xylan/chitin deacetylase (PgdA/CDA1 family)
LRTFTVCILLALLLGSSSAGGEKQVAVTFDDLPASQVGTFEDQLRVNRRILEVFEKYRARVTGFVITNRVRGKTDILDMWLDRGHELGNHTHSHMDFDRATVPNFQRNVDRGAVLLRELLNKHKRDLVYFRFPYFHEGSTIERREAIRKFLSERGYIVAPVSINPGDPEYNELFVKAWGFNDRRLQDSIRSVYVEQVKKKTKEAEDLAQELLGRNVKHILLLHLNRINSEALDQILEFYSESGYSFITLREALQDSVYSLKEEYVGSEELIWLEKLKLSQR